MTECWIEVTFEAAHRLPNVPKGHKCARLHGHSYEVTITVEGEVGEETGWVMDYAKIKAEWTRLHGILDHRYLNDISGLENSTSEILAEWIFNQLRRNLKGLSSVKVRETRTAGSTYRRQDGVL